MISIGLLFLLSPSTKMLSVSPNNILLPLSDVSNSIWNISQHALAQPVAITLSPPVSHNNTDPANSSFLTYQNESALGVVIQYPFNWKRIEVDGKAIIFVPPSRKDGFAEKLTVAVFNINSSVSPGQLSGSAINNYAEQYRDFFIIDSKPLTLQGNPAYTLSYTYNDPGAGQISVIDIGVKDGNKAYIISYSGQQLEYLMYVPAVEKMIESFHIISTPVPMTF